LRVPRVLRIWDQWAGLGEPSPAVQAPWRPENSYGYGRELAADDIAQLLQDDTDEERHYRYRLTYDPVLGRQSHGTHVLDVAAGLPDPLASSPDGHELPTPIVAVQLPWLPEKDVSGASLGVHLLDAIRYILDCAGHASEPRAPRNIVVNLSDGAMAGSHNGGSIIENALDELLQRPGLSLVIAAGNAYREKAHAEGRLAPLAEATLHWEVLPDDRTESFLEVWFSRSATTRVRLETPSGEPCFEVPVGESRIWPAAGTPEVLAAGIHLRAVASGKGQMALLALRPTRPNEVREGVVPHGVWKVVVRNMDRRSVAFNAWIERDDPPFGDREPRRQSRFVDDGTCLVSGENTLNSLATGRHPIVVGGYRLSGDAVAEYSAAGASGKRRIRPTVVAPSEESPALPGILAAGSTSGCCARMNGTSVAAPVVTRAIARALHSAPAGRLYRASEVKAAVEQAAICATPGDDPEIPEAKPDKALRTGSGWIRPGVALRLPP